MILSFISFTAFESLRSNKTYYYRLFLLAGSEINEACYDTRTNTAQFAVGKCALAFQLHALGNYWKNCK